MTTLNREPNDEREDKPDADAQDDGDNGGGTEDGDGEDDDDRSTDDDDARYEAEARSMGWVPESEWDDEAAERAGRRKPKRFVTAREFVEKGENHLPLLRSQVKELKKKNDEMYEILQENRKLQQAAIERARNEEREKLEEERRRAVAEGDVEAFDKAEKALNELPNDQPAPTQRQEDPDIVAFKEANKTWFTKDPALTDAMINTFGKVKEKFPAMSLREQLAEAKRRLTLAFPEEFGVNARREKARRSTATPTGGADQGSVDRRFAALTDAEKSMWERTRKMVESRGGKITKDEWMKEIGR